MTRTALAYRIALKSLEKINPSDHLRDTPTSSPEAMIMQKSKVLHDHYDLPKDVSVFEDKPEFDSISYLVRYLVDDKGNKKKKDAF